MDRGTSQAILYIFRELRLSCKEVIAQFILQHSRRAKKVMVPINCAALPEPLLESEMFGHRKGSFTGADRDKPGLLETANQGTLFLDELTEMSLPLQAKLLRVIQDGVVRRVGSEQADAVVDVRFISATNRDPQQAVQAGVLRGDLFYRLRVEPIHLPPLRKRPENIAILPNHFLLHYWRHHRQMPDRTPRLSDEAFGFLRSRPWKGNVLELQNVIELVAVLGGDRNSYYLLRISPENGGQVNCAYNEYSPPWHDRTWQPNFKSAAAKGSDAWTAEFALPFVIFSKNKTLASEIGFNVRRSGLPGQEIQGWQSTSVNPGDWGVLTGVIVGMWL